MERYKILIKKLGLGILAASLFCGSGVAATDLKFSLDWKFEGPSALFFTGRIGVNTVVGTLLLAAVAANEIETTRRLLEWGPDPKARADMGQRGLHLCKSAR